MKSFNLIFGILALASFIGMAYSDVVGDKQNFIGYCVATACSFVGFFVSAYFKLNKHEARKN
jgi:hypothetical protein